MSLASVLRRTRGIAGLTQEELAERAGISARTVSDVERGLRVRIYKDTAERLADALGLHGEARREFELAARGRVPAAAPATVLPIPPTRLIGRERELDMLLAALRRQDIRLVTVSGPGGIGKTRLALEAASRLDIGGAVTFVQLGTIADPTQVLVALAHAVGVSGAREASIEAIAELVGGRRLLVVLDTFEHVLDAAPKIAALLAACPRVTFLVTSRESLRIRGEHTVVLPTLAIPAAPSIDAVNAAPASELFIERAMAVSPEFVIDAAAAAVIAEICRRLGGLPLAIELAAARVKYFALPELRDQLLGSIDALSAGPLDLPPRQQTMRSTIAWSYALLDEQQRELFRDLCVFSGGWSLDAAAAVCARDVSDGLRLLVDKSLVVRSGATRSRYDMLDVIREFGVEAGITTATRDRHLAHFVAMAEEAEPHLGTGAQRVWLARLEHEHDNINSALRYALTHGDEETALRLSVAVWRYWMLQGHLGEGRVWLRQALAACTACDPHLRGKGMWALAWAAYHLGDYAEAAACGDRMMRLLEGRDDAVELRNALTIQGIVDLAYGRYAAAMEPLTRCVDVLGERDHGWLTATSLLNLGMASAHAGDPRARDVLEQARGRYVALGDRNFETRAVLYLGYAALVADDGSRAVACFRNSLIAFWELDDLWGVTEAVEGLAAAAATLSHAERASVLGGAADSLRDRLGTRTLPADGALLERTLTAARTTVSSDEWEQLWQSGQAMSAEAVVEYALSSTDAS